MLAYKIQRDVGAAPNVGDIYRQVWTGDELYTVFWLTAVVGEIGSGRTGRARRGRWAGPAERARWRGGWGEWGSQQRCPRCRQCRAVIGWRRSDVTEHRPAASAPTHRPQRRAQSFEVFRRREQQTPHQANCTRCLKFTYLLGHYIGQGGRTFAFVGLSFGGITQ